MIPCFFCRKDFQTWDEAYEHELTVNSSGHPICQKMSCRIDPQIWDEDIMPMMIENKKYFPVGNDGTYGYYDSQGKIVYFEEINKKGKKVKRFKSLDSMLLKLYSDQNKTEKLFAPIELNGEYTPDSGIGVQVCEDI